MLDFLFNVLRVGPVVTALIIVAAANIRRSRRVEQSWMPVVAIVFTAIVLVLLYRINDEVALGADLSLGPIPLTRGNTGTAWLYVVENTIVLLAFAAVKLLVRPFFARLFRGGSSVSQFAAARIYSFDPDFELWFIERRHLRVRDFYRVAYWSSMVITVLFIAFALTYSSWPGFSTVAFPALAAMLIGEFYFAVDGLSRDEYAEDLIGEKDVARRVGNFGPLRKILQDAFPEAVVGTGVHLSSLDSLDSGFRIGEMTRSGDPGTRLAGAYFDRLRRHRVDLDINLVGAAADLLGGRNVLIADPFHEDLTPYLCLPAYRELLEGRNVLLIAGRNSSSQDLVSWLQRGLEEITGIPKLWNVRILDEVHTVDTGVGVLRSADLHNLDLLQNNDGFLKDVGFLILAEPALMLATGQMGLEIVLDRCSQGSRPPTIAIFDANHDGLVDTLSHLTKSNLTEVVASSLPQGASSEVIWRADGPPMQASILPGVARYLGVGTEISVVALKFHVRRVQWVGADSFPVTDMRWIAQQYFSAINQFADLEMSQDALGDRVRAIPSPWELEQADNCFLVVEDPLNNVYETVRQYATRAKRAGFVNLISDDYMMRDYMVANRDLFSVDAKAVPSIVPDYTRTERNVVLRLLLTLRSFGISETELLRQMDLLGWSMPTVGYPGQDPRNRDWEPPAIGRLRQAIHEYTGVVDAPLSVETEREGGRRIFEDSQRRYVLETGSRLDEVIGSLAPAYFFVEDEDDGSSIIGSLLLDHVHQAMLPGQFLTYGGKYYEVRAITSERNRGRVVLRRAAEHIRDRRTYRQLRHYALDNLRPTESMAVRRQVGDIEVVECIADVSAQSLGYLQCPTRSDVANAVRAYVPGIPVRHYRKKAVLEIRLPTASAEVRTSIAILLNELFVTTFPYAYPYITAVTLSDEAELLSSLEVHAANEELRTFVVDDEGRGHIRTPSDHRSSIFIVEDSMIDMGLTAAVQRNWERLFEIITDYLEWYESPVKEPDEAPVLDVTRLFPPRPTAERPEPQSSWLSRVVARARSLMSRDVHSQNPADAPPSATGDAFAEAEADSPTGPPDAPDALGGTTLTEVAETDHVDAPPERGLDGAENAPHEVEAATGNEEPAPAPEAEDQGGSAHDTP